MIVHVHPSLGEVLSFAFIVGICVAIGVFWALGAYNRLVRLRADVALAGLALLRQWQSQAQLLTHALAGLPPLSERDSMWQSLSDEHAPWRSLAQAAKQLQACLTGIIGDAQSHVRLPPVDDLSSAQSAKSVLDDAWQRLRAQHDDLAGAAVPQQLLMQWQQQCTLSEERRAHYNAGVQTYHQAITQFPAMVLAWVCSFDATTPL